MNDRSTPLLDLVVAGLAASFRRAPGFEPLIEPGAGCILTGEPVPTFNMLILGPARDPDAALRTFIERARRRSLPVYILVAHGVEREAARVAEDLKLLEDPHHYPLMVFQPPDPPEPADGWRISRVRDEPDLAICRDLIHRATAIDPSICGRVVVEESLGECLVEGSRVEVDYYLAHHEGRPRSTVRTTRHHGKDDISVGIWSMATPPEHQRRGAGKALLLGMMRDQMRRGAGRFFLCSTPAGRRLYEVSGFRVVDPWKAWSDGLTVEELADAY